MSRTVVLLALVLVGVMAMYEILHAQGGGAAAPPAAGQPASTPAALSAKRPLDVTMKSLDDKDVNLAKKYEGKVVLLVNVASRCGNTPQYGPLQALHEKYAEQGLAIVGVPCNQFGGQEPGTAAQIKTFCETEYGVKFDLLAKVEVNGENACPLYKHLTSEQTNPKFAGRIPWNFEKFLFNREGQVVARFNHRVKPDTAEIVKAIEAELAKKAPPKAETKAAGAASN
jgi:glutathione peroxidase